MTTDRKRDKNPGDVVRKDTDVKDGRSSRREKDVVTEGSEDSFPASDPPSFMGGSVVSGSPPTRKPEESGEAGKAPGGDKDRKKD